MQPELRASFFHDDEGFVARLRGGSGPEECFRAAHTLKSITLMLGLEDFAKMLLDIEDRIVRKEMKAAGNLIQIFLKEFEKAKSVFLAEDCTPEASHDDVVEVLFRPRVLKAPVAGGRRYVYHRRCLIPLDGPLDAEWVVLLHAGEGGALRALAVSEWRGVEYTLERAA